MLASLRSIMMIEKAMDADGKRLFQDGEKSILKNAVEAAVLQDIQLAMLSSGTEIKRWRKRKQT